MPKALVVSSDPASKPAAMMLARFLKTNLGVDASVKLGAGDSGIDLRTGTLEGVVSKEGYLLTVGTKKISVLANSAAGVFYGYQTLRQLLAVQTPGSIQLPRIKVTDEPRFGWRGLHLDVSRHFFTPKEIRLYLDYMAELKLNVFHWHLVDDGGWRMEVPRYPKLTDVGAWRLQRPGEVWNYGNIEFPGKDSGQPLYGGFYTQKEIADIVEYAAARNISVLPEIETPGHSLPAVVAYPEVSCTVDLEPGRSYRSNAFCAGKEETFRFLEHVLDETMKLFPSKIIHIGGDELDKYYWSRCPDCQKRMKDEGLKTLDELQSYFIQRVEKYLNSKGRTLIGWDEILEGGLAPNAMVMSWRGTAGGIAAAKSGHQVAMSPTSHCYFDYGYEGTSTEKVYGYEPVPSELEGAERDLVLGAQANVWTEWIADFDKVETMIFPRILAMAETLWVQPEKKDFADFSDRLNAFYPQFVKRGIDFYVEPPRAQASLIVFDQECLVRFDAPNVPGVELRYSVDGTNPTAQSAVYTGPIRVSANTTVKAAICRGSKIDGAVATTECRQSVPDAAITPLSVEVYEGKFDRLPDFGVAKPAESQPVSDMRIEPFLSKETFALRWTGTLKIDRPGTYTFVLGSDDGTVLKIAGAKIIDADQPQGYIERSGRALLAKGNYAFEVGYFQQGGAARFAAFVEGPGLERGPFERLVVRP